MERKSCLLLLNLAIFVLILTTSVYFQPSTCQPEELSPATILSEVEKSCVLVLFSQNIDNLRTFVDELHQILTGRPTNEITFVTSGLASEEFIWPNSQPLKWVSKSSSGSDGGTLVAFPKSKKDTECLITGPRTNPRAEQFTGVFTVKAVLDWVNAKCNTYISPAGGLTYGGMHRESILQNLFSVSHVSNFTMRDFSHQHQGISMSNINNVSDQADTMICKQRKCEPYIWDFECSKNVEGFCSESQRETASGNGIYTKPIPAVDSVHSDSEWSKIISAEIARHSDHKPSNKNIGKDPPSKKQFPQCERLSTLPDKGQFFYDYLKTSKPVVIEGAAAHWEAFHKWTMEFLRERYGKKEVHIKLAPDGLFEGVDKSSNWEEYSTFTIPTAIHAKLPFPDLVVVRPATMNLKFAEFLDMISNASKMAKDSSETKSRASAYLEYSSIPNYLPELERDIQEFPFVQELLARRHLNIWLSDGNTLGKLHFDPFDNFLCQIRGRKQLTLFEPHDNTRMYEGHIPEAKLGYDRLSGRFRRKKLLDSTAMVMAPVDILDPDFERFPAFAETHPLNCTINEGDVLFMPAFWWHEVQSYPNVTEGRNLAVNFWYEPFLTKEFPCAHCKLDVNPLYRHLL